MIFTEINLRKYIPELCLCCYILITAYWDSLHNKQNEKKNMKFFRYENISGLWDTREQLFKKQSLYCICRFAKYIILLRRTVSVCKSLFCMNTSRYAPKVLNSIYILIVKRWQILKTLDHTIGHVKYYCKILRFFIIIVIFIEHFYSHISLFYDT